MKLPSLRPVVAAALLGLASAAQAAIMSPVPDLSGNFSVTDTTGPQAPETFNFNISPTTNPVPVVFYDTNPPANQSPSSIAGLIATDYGISAASLTNVHNCDNIGGGCTGMTANATTFSLTDMPSFDFLALHFGGGELLFHWAQPVASMTLTALDGFPGGLSDYRAYLSTPLPGAFALFLSALGFLGLRRKLAGTAEAQPTPA